jgi:FkbM family methyltransferase
MASRAGPAGRVHAFEPNPMLQNLIEQSLDRNRYNNVTLHKMALGSTTGQLTLHVPLWNSGQGSFLYNQTNPSASHHEVQVRALSDVVLNEGIKHIRMLKIDVEGYENDVLVGGRDILGTIRPDVIVFESNEQQRPDFKDRPAVKTLQSLGYRFLSIPKALLFMSLQPFDPDITTDPGHDIVAVPSEKYENIFSLTR